MAGNLTDVWEIVDRSIFEVIRVALVTEGYTADITLFPNTPQGVIDYKAAMAAIKTTKGFVIELYGGSSPYKKYEKIVPRIVYLPKRAMPGDLGGGNVVRWNKVGGTYLGRVEPTQTTNFQFEISLVSNEIRQDRVMNAIIGLVFSKRAFVPFYNNTEGDFSEFFIAQTSFRDYPDTEYNRLEKIYEYMATDLWDKVVTTEHTAAPLNQVTLDVHLGDSEAPDSTTIIQ